MGCKDQCEVLKKEKRGEKCTTHKKKIIKRRGKKRGKKLSNI
jgi:hypothetical protein